MTSPKITPVNEPENAFEALLQQVFAWITDHSREVVVGLVALIVIGGGSAVTYEWLTAREVGANEALAGIESALVRELGGDPLANNGFAPALLGDIMVPTPLEPADAARARTARETALAGFGKVSDEHSGTFAATVAQIRAAEMETELERYADADKRLAALIDDLGSRDPVRGVALQMRGYVLEEQEHAQEAADLYVQAGAIESYPGRVQAYLAAAETFDRLGMRERTLECYDAISKVSPEFAQQAGILDRMDDLRAAVAKPGERAESGGGAAAPKAPESAATGSGPHVP